MIDEPLTIDLPAPWSHTRFETNEVGPINYLVGPNGSGKSRFAAELLAHLKARPSGARLLGTDRLKEMAHPGRMGNYWGDNLSAGYAKGAFGELRAAGAEGSGIDTFLLLEERMELRIRIEATLGHLFDRDVVLEWDSGHLVPKAARREGGESYRLDRDECHGIKELLVLLTHLYDHGHGYLIIDEPELNLHPQLQAFFMQEVRQLAGKPGGPAHKKVVFLITHSPFILDLRCDEDIKSVISFDLTYSVPKQIARATPDLFSAVLASGRSNAHHKQLFFSDSPVFVEGFGDALMVEGLMEARGVSAAAAGSCIIDCGGAEEVNHYLKLCQGLGKEAHFVYDLDSVFKGQLGTCLRDDGTIESFLAAAGVGTDFPKYVGELKQCLTALIDVLLGRRLVGPLERLGRFLNDLGGDRKEWTKEQLSKAWVATMTMLSLSRDDIAAVVPQDAVQDIEGRWQTILRILAERNIHVLPGGTIERYLPTFAGDPLDPKSAAKRGAVVTELSELQRIRQFGKDGENALLDRYGDLYRVVSTLPSRTQVDFDGTLRRHLSDYVHELQKVVEAHPDWELERVEGRMRRHPLPKSGVVSLERFQRHANGRFEATIGISDMFGKNRRYVEVDTDTTIGNMPALREE